MIEKASSPKVMQVLATRTYCCPGVDFFLGSGAALTRSLLTQLGGPKYVGG